MLHSLSPLAQANRHQHYAHQMYRQASFLLDSILCMHSFLNDRINKLHFATINERICTHENNDTVKPTIQELLNKLVPKSTS